MDIDGIVTLQREFFASGKTKSLSFRLAALKKLGAAIEADKEKLFQALHEDLHKAPYEAYMTEIGLVLDELRYQERHLKHWMKNKRVPTALALAPSRSFVMHEPYGVVLVMSPWNYPVLLTLEPLIGAVAAGNCVVVKPSAHSSHTSQAIADLIEENFEPGHITVVQGGRAENTGLLEQKFDYLFFTGSEAVGKAVMQAASKHLTPMSLELGGKSPVIVDKTADIDLAAKRIVFGKLVNAGQTCVAPDYLLVDKAIKADLIGLMRQYLEHFLGANPMDHPEYPKIINQSRFDHLLSLLEGCHVLIGGNSSFPYIEPTVVDGVTGASLIMQEEIFGPLLPVISYDTIEEAIACITCRSKPLALYLFTRDRNLERRILSSVSFGGGCVNDTIMHIATPHMPFGGIGGSGMGRYHGKASFETFSNSKSILKKGKLFDMPLRYHPYSMTKMRLLRKVLR